MKNYLRNYIYENIKVISIILLCVAIGIIIGSLVFNYSNENIKNQIINISKNTLDIAKNENFEGINVLLNGIKTNIPVIIFIYFSAITFIPMFLINITSFIKGISIGIYASILLSLFGVTKGIFFSLLVIFIPNVIYIMAYIFICNNSLILHNKFMENGIKIYDVIFEIVRIVIGFSTIFLSVILEQITLGIAVNKFF